MRNNLNTSLNTKRLNIRLATDNEMKQLILNEKNEDMKSAYTQMLKASQENPEQRQWYGTWIIKLLNDPSITIGDLSFKGLKNDIVEIGYGIKEEYWNNGYATEAVHIMKLWALKQPLVSKVEAEAEKDNIASIKVLEKNNFVLNGVIGEEGPRYIYTSKKNIIQC